MVSRAGKSVVNVDFSQPGIDGFRFKGYFDFAASIVAIEISGRKRKRVSPIRIPEPRPVVSVEGIKTIGVLNRTTKTAIAGAHQDRSQPHLPIAILIRRRLVRLT